MRWRRWVRFSRNRLVLAAAAASESAWVFAAASTAAVAIGYESSPLAWPAVLLVLSAAVVIGRLTPSDMDAVEVVNLVLLLLAAAVVYLTVATQVNPAGLDLGWIAGFGSDASPAGFTFRAVVGSVLGAALWWRGGRLAVAEEPLESLTSSMRIGIVVMGVAMITDAASEADLRIFPTALVFFGFGLAGLGVGNLMAASTYKSRVKVWPRVLSGVVAVVVVVGLLLSLIRDDLLSYVSTPAAFVLSVIGKAVFFLIAFPALTVVNFVVDLLISFFDGVLGIQQDRGEQFGPGDAAAAAAEAERLKEEAESFNLALQVLEIVLIIALSLLALYILLNVLRKILQGRGLHSGGERESVGQEASVFSDIGRLLYRLVPDALKQTRKARAYMVPEGPAGIVEVFRIYYRLLSLAERRGIKRQAHETVTEFEDTLARSFPRDVVRSVTAAFNRACYGHHPASEEQIAEMRSGLSRIPSGPGMTDR